MKILAIGAPSPDYLQDDLLHGLMSLDGVEVETHVNFGYLFDDYPHDITNLYGRGISYAKNIPAHKRRDASLADILYRIQAQYYDAVIYLSIWRCQDFLGVVEACYPMEKVALVDGEDSPNFFDRTMQGIYFKRELMGDPSDETNLYPISFAIPAEKLCLADPVKTRQVSAQIPGETRNYQFTNEADYYAEYQASRYAFTRKKAGWDCKRHYEILANKCIPLFTDIFECPKFTCITLPKRQLEGAMMASNYWNAHEYRERQQWFFEYTRDNLTTRHLAQYLLERICV